MPGEIRPLMSMVHYLERLGSHRNNKLSDVNDRDRNDLRDQYSLQSIEKLIYFVLSIYP